MLCFFLFELTSWLRGVIFAKVSPVKRPSVRWTGQHLTSAETTIPLRIKTSCLALEGATIIFGPGFLHMKQYAWLLLVVGRLRVTNGGLEGVWYFVLPCFVGGSNSSKLRGSHHIPNKVCWQSFCFPFDSTSVYILNTKHHNHSLKQNCFTNSLAYSAFMLNLSAGTVRRLQTQIGYDFGPFPGIFFLQTYM